MSFNISFKLKEDKTIDPESFRTSGTPPVGVEISLWGHADIAQTQIGLKVGDLTAMATAADAH